MYLGVFPNQHQQRDLLHENPQQNPRRNSEYEGRGKGHQSRVFVPKGNQPNTKYSQILAVVRRRPLYSAVGLHAPLVQQLPQLRPYSGYDRAAQLLCEQPKRGKLRDYCAKFRYPD